MLLRQRRIRQRVRCPPHLLNVYFFVLKCTLNLPFNLTLGSRAGAVICVGTTPEKPEKLLRGRCSVCVCLLLGVKKMELNVPASETHTPVCVCLLLGVKNGSQCSCVKDAYAYGVCVCY